ncbi:unnamed protein product [Closterium sp. NIES-65]|nr:unnamed protein product [Closterium sp. NIES-65]
MARTIGIAAAARPVVTPTRRFVSLVASAAALLLLANAALPALADSTQMAAASRRVMKAAALVAAPAPGAGTGAPAVGAPPPPLAPLDQYYDNDYMQDYTLEQVIAAASPQAAPGAPPSLPRSLRLKVPYTIKFADVSKLYYILNYLANSVCKFPAGPTIFLPTNQAWSDAFEGYKKSRSSGVLYEALDAVASDRIKKAFVWAGRKINSTELSVLADKAKSCKTLTSHPIREAARTALYNLMSFHTAAFQVTILNLDNQCTASGTPVKTAFNGNNLNFKCNSTDAGFISASDPLASGVAAGTPSAVAMIDEPKKDYFYVNAVVFPINISSLLGAVATVLRLLTALLVFPSALACAL